MFEQAEKKSLSNVFYPPLIMILDYWSWECGAATHSELTVIQSTKLFLFVLSNTHGLDSSNREPSIIIFPLSIKKNHIIWCSRTTWNFVLFFMSLWDVNVCSNLLSYNTTSCLRNNHYQSIPTGNIIITNSSVGTTDERYLRTHNKKKLRKISRSSSSVF